MKYRLVAVDYDRTISDGNLRPHPEALEALAALRQQGVHTALATGRFSEFVARFLARFPESVESAVAENGCVGFALGKKELLCDPDGREGVLARVRSLPVGWAAGEVVISVVAEARERVLSVLPHTFEAIANVDALMLVPRGVSKATGLAWLQRTLGVPPQETAVFGDGENDLCLRPLCGFFGAPANSLPEVKAVADVVSPEEYGAGTARMLREFLRE